MPGKLANNKKICEGQRAHAVKLLSSVNEVLSEYDGSRGAKDNITRLSIALNEKLVTLKALDESILCAVDDREIESEIEESENFRAQIHEALVKLQTRGVLLGILGGGVPPGSSNPDPISDLNMPFSTPIFRPDL